MGCRLVVLLAALCVCTSCVSRRLTIETTPPGARVFMERKEIGTTPLTIDFEYGGTRELLLLHEEGDIKYAPVRVRHESEEFFLDVFPFDVFARLQPVAIERDFHVHVTLEESRLTDIVLDDEKNYLDALLQRAEQMRARARQAQKDWEAQSEEPPPPTP